VPPIALEVNGKPVEVPDDGSTLLAVLREGLGLTSVKDGCSPQGQCGCCTVLVDGAPRVACVTPVRRVRGRSVTTLDGLDPTDRQAWGEAFCATGGSQCGFCTPGIVVRLAGLAARSGGDAGEGAVEQALLAHLCRCTGWRTILDAWHAHGAGATVGPDRDLAAASERASIEGGATQRVSPDVALGLGGFADDGAPPGALVAVPDGAGGWTIGETLDEARAAAGKVQGRRTTVDLRHPLAVPPGDWAATLRTTWVEPAYLELDAAWCAPGGEPATPLANGGAFGGKRTSVVVAAARDLADQYGRPVRAVLAREDAVRLGPKRPPVAGGIRRDGTGVLRVVATPGIEDAVAAMAPEVSVEQVEGVDGPPTSLDLRATGWAEAVALLAAVAQERTDGPGPVVVHPAPGPDAARVTVRSPAGATATAEVGFGDAAEVHVRVACGRSLDDVVLRSYCVGAAHMALGWVCSEGIAVDEAGTVHDLTIRSFGILRAVDMPPVIVDIAPSDASPVNGSDAVFAAVAAAAWRAQGCPPEWPTGRRPRG
jgi:aerobic-type carbon monoxide dehydrogenase small subunit (CoxS/CutS family)